MQTSLQIFAFNDADIRLETSNDEFFLNAKDVGAAIGFETDAEMFSIYALLVMAFGDEENGERIMRLIKAVDAYICGSIAPMGLNIGPAASGMYHITRIAIAACDKSGLELSDIHPLFSNGYKKFFPNMTIVEHRKKNVKIRPDFFLRDDDELIPVEIKRDSFGENAMQQLLNYMKVFDCKRGVAVGSVLCSNLPENVVFIKISELRKEIRR